MDAGEALEAELVGAVCTVPHACFLHRTPPALPVSPTICRLVRWIGRFLSPSLVAFFLAVLASLGLYGAARAATPLPCLSPSARARILAETLHQRVTAS